MESITYSKIIQSKIYDMICALISFCMILKSFFCRYGEKFAEMGGGQIRAASADFGIRVSGTQGN